MTFTNISCLIIDEGYLNFGLVGIIVFAIVCGLIIGKVDTSFWKSKINDPYHVVLYPVLVLLSFFLFRGDMMSGMAFLSSYLVVWIIISMKSTQKAEGLS